jgi:hypothetical protein
MKENQPVKRASVKQGSKPIPCRYSLIPRVKPHQTRRTSGSREVLIFWRLGLGRKKHPRFKKTADAGNPPRWRSSRLENKSAAFCPPGEEWKAAGSCKNADLVLPQVPAVGSLLADRSLLLHLPHRVLL